jgi:hypothetical protein
MKNLLIISGILMLMFSACMSGEVSLEDGETQIIGAKLYEGNGFTFKYPDTWEQLGDYLYEGGFDGHRMQVYTADFFGPRCVVDLGGISFVDNSERAWDYAMTSTGLPEGMEEMCAEFEGGTDKKTLSVGLENDDGYLAVLFYEYTLDQEISAIEEFQAILGSIEIE